MFSSLSGTLGLSFDSTLLSPLLFLCLVLLLFPSCWPILLTFFPWKYFSIFHYLRQAFLYGPCLAARHSSWYVQLAFQALQRLSIPICCEKKTTFFNTFETLVLINRWSGPQYQHVLALCAFYNRGNIEGTDSSKFLCFDGNACMFLWETNCSKTLCLMFVYVFLTKICVRTDFFQNLENLWFDVQCAE